MKSSLAFLLFSLFLFPLGRSLAQQSPDPKQAKLIAYAHFKTLMSAEQDQLLSKAQSGDAEAQYWMGVLTAEGTVPKNLEQGRRWLLKSAEQGYAPAQLAYGLMTVRSDASVGERWMLQAAEQEDSEAQFWLGFGHEQDWFGAADVKEAVKWYQKAAQGGDPDAQVELGQRYEYGKGVEQNFKLAAEWYRRAAEHVPDLGGAGQGKNQLGLLYMEGRGVPQDYVHAYFWFSLSGSKENASQAKEHLSPAQIRGVERLIDEWKQYHRPSPELAAALHTMALSEETYVPHSDGGGTPLIPTTESKLPSALDTQSNPQF
jgi:TPR repeat protein